MTRQELEKTYAVDTHGLICDPGKFEGEALYVPYFWDVYLNGFADDDDGKTLTFNVDDDDRKQFPELSNVHHIELWEDDNGFVYCDTFNETGTQVKA